MTMTDLAQKVLSVSTAYLGPAAKMFLARQTKYHLHGLDYDQLQKEHLSELSRWIFISGSLVIEKDKAQELSQLVARLA
jgi:hypothetical protein